VFYLRVLWDAEDEFQAARSLGDLKAVEIPPSLEGRVQRGRSLNQKLLRADPSLEQIAGTLSGATRVAAHDREGGVDLGLMSQKSWDLLSKPKIIIRNEPDWPWLPLRRHG
jgi:putative ATP-dependent endonuclease of OLD family